jgi:hypothetical protein
MTVFSLEEIMRNTRYHEAGHAVAAYLHGYLITGVTVSYEECKTYFCRPIFEGWADSWREACVIMAGVLADQRAMFGEMHGKLKVTAAQIGVDVEKDKVWPKSARWLWRRIKEALSLLVAAGIEASRGRDESAKQITLRRFPTNDGSDDSGGESRTDKGETHANTAQDDGRSNGSDGANGIPNGSEKPQSDAAFANNANTAIRFGDFSEEVCTPEQAERIRNLVK